MSVPDNLILNPSKIEDIDKHISEIENIIDLSEKDIIFVRENFKSKAKLNREIVLKQNLSQEEIAKFESRRYQFKNTFIEERYSRENIYSELFSHSVGYVGDLSDDSLELILKDQGLNPKETIFLKRAKLFGNKTENGKMMFIYQAHQSFTIWNKVMPKIDDETIKLI